NNPVPQEDSAADALLYMRAFSVPCPAAGDAACPSRPTHSASKTRMNAAIEVAAKRGKTGTALAAIESPKKTRAAPVEERKRESATLVTLHTERAQVAAKERQAETEAAPIRYVAEMLGADTDSERTIPWLIALMVNAVIRC